MFGPEGMDQHKFARRVRDRAEAIRLGMPLDSAGKNRRRGMPILRLSLVFWVVLSAVFYFLPARSNLPLSLGLGNFWDALLFKMSPPSVTGDRAWDRAVASAAQAAAVFLCAGALPFLTRTWISLRDKAHANSYIVYMGVTVGVPFAFLFWNDFLSDVVLGVMGG